MNYREASRELTNQEAIEALDNVVGDLDEMLYCSADEDLEAELNFDD